MTMCSAITQVLTLALMTALASGASAQQWTACVTDENGVLPADCLVDGAGKINPAPLLPNTEPEAGPQGNKAGFVLSLDGKPLNADPNVEDLVRQTDVALAQADVKIQLDTLTTNQVLDVEVAGESRAYEAGQTVTLISETNYPAFLARAEMRIIDQGAAGGPKLLQVVPVDINGRVIVTLPEGSDLAVTHRVYDARGRYDETQPLPLGEADDRRQLDAVEEGNDYAARRGIRVNGGTVTVSATDVARGATLTTMGESVRPDARGNLVIARILPAGEYAIDVTVTGAGQNVGLTRPIDIPNGAWFYVLVADLTVGRFSDGQSGEDETRTTGRLQYFVEGETQSGVRIISSLDTGEGELDEIFKRLDEKDPRSVTDRLDPADGYPTYGDDSTIEDLTPTSGRIYLRVERDKNFLVWGDYKAQLIGNGYLRNERSLYGLQVHAESQTTTARGDARASFDLYAAQPDQLVGRDAFLGTGGSVYFLSEQDVSPGTQTVTVELRDSVTGRVTDRLTLVEGRDYQINALQGVVTLTSPLSDTVDRRLISSNPGGDESVFLVVQYEYTPTGTDVDGLSFGGRAEAWVTDDVRLGVTAIEDETGNATQKSVGIDIRYEFGANSFVQLDYAESSGPGFDSAFSQDGGLVFDTEAGIDDEGRAIKLEAQFDLGDLGASRDGVIGGYFEDREEGFSSLDYSVTSATGDEWLYGLYAIVKKSPTAFGYSLYADVYDNAVGDERLEIGGSLEGDWSDRLGYAIGVEYVDEVDGGVAGDRTDVAARFTYTLHDAVDVYAFGQMTVASDVLDDNDRFGLGVDGEIGNGWEVAAEVSDGTGGFGTRLLATHRREDNSSVYFGYELDPRRAIDAGVAQSDNGGQYVTGGTRDINEETTIFAENTYAIFGDTRELISSYGVTHSPSTFLSYTVTLNYGQLEDAVNGDLERNALSFGVRYEDDDVKALGRIEWRRDNFEDPAEPDAVAFYLVADLAYKISEEARFLFNADVAITEANGVSFQEGELVDVSLGYAYRPIDNERLNVLGRYRYFYDDLGQEIDGASTGGAIQRSHVLSVEGNYDLTQRWTVGGKLGGRWADTAPMAGLDLASNDAVLAVLNARFHAVHEWDILLEARHLELLDAGSSDSGILAAVYRQMGEHVQAGVGYNFGSFSDDLTDLTFEDDGIFLNVVAAF
ncbi:MAG: hypothetical protein MK180_14215 [Rhodobacteraceae bacterium]|nr:hypothetical protein [Paracoccaceae bacterium]